MYVLRSFFTHHKEKHWTDMRTISNPCWCHTCLRRLTGVDGRLDTGLAVYLSVWVTKSTAQPAAGQWQVCRTLRDNLKALQHGIKQHLYRTALTNSSLMHLWCIALIWDCRYQIWMRPVMPLVACLNYKYNKHWCFACDVITDMCWIFGAH